MFQHQILIANYKVCSAADIMFPAVLKTKHIDSRECEGFAPTVRGSASSEWLGIWHLTDRDLTILGCGKKQRTKIADAHRATDQKDLTDCSQYFAMV